MAPVTLSARPAVADEESCRLYDVEKDMPVTMLPDIAGWFP